MSMKSPGPEISRGCCNWNRKHLPLMPGVVAFPKEAIYLQHKPLRMDFNDDIATHDTNKSTSQGVTLAVIQLEYYPIYVRIFSFQLCLMTDTSKIWRMTAHAYKLKKKPGFHWKQWVVFIFNLICGGRRGRFPPQFMYTELLEVSWKMVENKKK